mmetsp:Transcript_14935/g.40041  ORF Transcript_14935/g.40041 Transcript_14935/m.40041 type:complete len:133 (-) Transcript_14935:634-1032(-)
MNGENAAAGSAELMGSKRDGSENPHVGTDEVSRDVDPKDLGFLFDIVRVPCFRDSLLFGIPAGLVLGALRFYRLSDATRATDLAIKGIAAFSMTSWYVALRPPPRPRETSQLLFFCSVVDALGCGNSSFLAT